MAAEDQDIISPLPAVDVSFKGSDRNLRTLNAFKPKQTTPEKAINEDPDTLIGRAQWLMRNSGMCSGALRKITDQVIGHQYRIDLRPDYKTLGISREVATDWAQATGRRFNNYFNSSDNQVDASRRMSGVGLLRAAYGSFWVTGDSFIAREFMLDRIDKRNTGMAATCFNLLDSDRITNPKNKPEMQVQDIRRGVVVNDFGEALGYWLASRSENGLARQGSGQIDYKYIARRNENFLNIIHTFDVPVGGTQSRGVSRLASIVELSKQKDQMTLAELESVIVNASLSYYMKSEHGPESAFQALGSGPQGGTFAEQWTAQSEWAKMNPIKHDGNALVHLFPGEEIGQLKGERGGALIGEFSKVIDRQIASGMHSDYETVSGDMTASSFATLKAIGADRWGRTLSEREVAINPIMNAFFQAWLDEMILRKIVPTPNGMNYMENRQFLTQARWIGAPKAVFDSTSEATAQNIRLANLSISPYDIASESGYDIDEMLDDHEEFQRQLEVRKLTINRVSQQAVNQAGQTGQNI